MEQLKKLKRRSIASLLALILLLGAIGVFGVAASNLFAKEPEARNLYEVPREELEGAYVTVEVEWIYGCYAYTETYENNRPTGEITQQEYVIDANETDYMCLILDGDWMDKADDLLDECDAFYYGETDQVTKTFTVTGEVKRLPSDSLELYHEAMGYDMLTPAEQEILLPLYLSPASYDLEPVPLFFGLFFIGIALFFLVSALSGAYQKQIKQKLQELFGDNTERADEFLRHMMSTPAVQKMHIDGGYILLQQGITQMLLDSSDLVWAYKQTVRQKLYGIIPMGKSHRLVLKLANKKEVFVVMKEAQIKEQLNKILQQFPTCAIGYSDQMAALYKKDPNVMRQVAAAQRSSAPNT